MNGRVFRESLNKMVRHLARSGVNYTGGSLRRYSAS